MRSHNGSNGTPLDDHPLFWLDNILKVCRYSQCHVWDLGFILGERNSLFLRFGLVSEWVGK
jgi:hypothetical protein